MTSSSASRHRRGSDSALRDAHSALTDAGETWTGAARKQALLIPQHKNIHLLSTFIIERRNRRAPLQSFENYM